MKKIFLILFSLLSFRANASWVNWFKLSDQQYKIYIVSDNQLQTTAGFYLTTFPCYGEYNQEYYKTIPGKNMITLYCMEPPTEIYLTYIVKPLGSFFPLNEKAQGYMKCPVVVTDNVGGGVIPRLQVNLQDCERKQLNYSANKNIIKKYGGVEL